MKLVFSLIIVFLVVCFTFCYRGYTFKNTAYCFDNINTELSSKLELKGFYVQKEVTKTNNGYPPKTVIDTSERHVVFYNDGILLYNFVKELFIRKKDRKQWLQYNSGYRGGYSPLWGRYVLQGDTIKAHFMVGPESAPNRPWGYIWFKIIDKNTIRKICFKWADPITQKDVITYLENPPEWRIFQTDAKFIPYDSLPDPNLSWIKKKKWFWCDEQQYKAWKNRKGKSQ